MSDVKKKIIKVAAVPQSLNVLLRGQMAMLSEYYDIVCVASPGKALEEVGERESVRTTAIPIERRISPLKDIISLWRLFLLFLRERPDMVHSITPKAGFLSMLAARFAGVPVRMHTFTGLIFPTSSGFRRKLLMMTDRMTCKCATHINPEGKGVKSDLERYGITNKPMDIIGNGNVNGINLDFFKRSDDVIRLSIPYFKPELITFLFIGRIVRDKGINEMVRSFERIHRKYSATRLLLVGSLEEKTDPVDSDVLSFIRNSDAVEYVGFQSDVRPFFAVSDVFVFPSYREGFPNVVMQAGAMGLPCIVTDINGSNEIIEDGRNGVIIPSKDEPALYDAMEMFLKEPELIMSLSKDARSMIADRYDQKHFWTLLLDYYRKILRQS